MCTADLLGATAVTGAVKWFNGTRVSALSDPTAAEAEHTDIETYEERRVRAGSDRADSGIAPPWPLQVGNQPPPWFGTKTII